MDSIELLAPTASPGSNEIIRRSSPFSKLPPELKLRVYKFLALQPRNLKLQIKSEVADSTRSASVQRGFPLHYFVCDQPVPVALQICHASREIAKNFYMPSFKTAFNSRFIWANLAMDTIRVSESTLYFIKERPEIQLLAVEEQSWAPTLDQYLKPFIPMTKLVRLDIMSAFELRMWAGDLDLIWGWFEDKFGHVDGWVHPDVRIIEEATGAELTYLNEERMIDRFAREGCKIFLNKLALRGGNNRQGVGHHSDDRSPGGGGGVRRNRRRPISLREEPLDCSQACSVGGPKP